MAARRTCIACRAQEDRPDLVRLTLAPDGSVVVDYRAKLGGRGAWVHAAAECVAKLEKRPAALARALKTAVTELRIADPMRDMAHRAVLDGLSQSAAAGALISGHDALEAALKNGEVEIVAVAGDAAERTVRSLQNAASDGIVFAVLPLTRDELGVRIGQPARAAVGATGSPAASHLIRQLRRLAKMG